MKNLTIAIILTLAISVSSFGEVSTSWVNVKNIHSGSSVNERVGDEYYPVQFYFDGTAVDSGKGKRPVRAVINLGTPQAEPFDLETLQGQKLWYQALPAVLKPIAKDLRIQATNEDISTE